MTGAQPSIRKPRPRTPELRGYRYEIKFATTPGALPVVRSWVRLHPAAFRRAYPPRQVNSLYFDTATWAGLEDNLAGVAERDKLRLRWYGGDLGRIDGALELKAKRGELGTKVAVPLDRPLTLDDRRWSDVVHDFRSRSLAALAPAASRKSLPIVIIRYRREYFVTADRTVRLTIDSETTVFDQTRAAHPNLRRVIPAEPALIVELKADADHRRSLQAVASHVPLVRVAFSKYCRGVLAALGREEPAAGALGRVSAAAHEVIRIPRRAA